MYENFPLSEWKEIKLFELFGTSGTSLMNSLLSLRTCRRPCSESRPPPWWRGGACRGPAPARTGRSVWSPPRPRYPRRSRHPPPQRRSSCLWGSPDSRRESAAPRWRGCSPARRRWQRRDPRSRDSRSGANWQVRSYWFVAQKEESRFQNEILFL